MLAPMRIGRRLAAALVVLMLASTGCGGGDEQTSAPKQSSPPSKTAPQTREQRVDPAAALSAVGAKEVIREPTETMFAHQAGGWDGEVISPGGYAPQLQSISIGKYVDRQWARRRAAEVNSAEKGWAAVVGVYVVEGTGQNIGDRVVEQLRKQGVR
jgi:hypothetical protein